MEFRDVVRRRHMVRAYDDRPVPRDVLDRVLDAGLRAPSAGFSQGWAFVILDRPEETERFWTLTRRPHPPEPGGRQAGMRTAPVIVLPLANKQAPLARAREPDKTGLGMDQEAGWPLPYWD